jgi:hypothetical protein
MRYFGLGLFLPMSQRTSGPPERLESEQADPVRAEVPKLVEVQ